MVTLFGDSMAIRRSILDCLYDSDLEHFGLERSSPFYTLVFSRRGDQMGFRQLPDILQDPRDVYEALGADVIARFLPKGVTTLTVNGSGHMTYTRNGEWCLPDAFALAMLRRNFTRGFDLRGKARRLEQETRLFEAVSVDDATQRVDRLLREYLASAKKSRRTVEGPKNIALRVICPHCGMGQVDVGEFAMRVAMPISCEELTFFPLWSVIVYHAYVTLINERFWIVREEMTTELPSIQPRFGATWGSAVPIEE